MKKKIYCMNCGKETTQTYSKKSKAWVCVCGNRTVVTACPGRF